MLRGLGTALAPLCEPLGGLVPGEWLQECKAAGDTLGTMQSSLFSLCLLF